MEQRVKRPARKTRRSRAGNAPTIGDVARLAGVSPMTVSRVMNGETNVRPATRDSVKAAITELNYLPNAAARSLAGAGQIKIGLLYGNPSEGFMSRFFLGILEQAARSDVQIVVEQCEFGAGELSAAEPLVRGSVNGVILPPPLCESKELLDYFEAHGIPTVAVATASNENDSLSVRIDDHEAARALTRHILSLGHRKIGFIVGNPNLSASALRYEGYRDALTEAGIALDDSLVVQGYFSYRSGLDAAEQLLGRPDRPSAIFSSNDDMAAAAVAVAHRHGLDVPGDLTVCGFDDTVLATAIWPELTTIHQPITDMARAAVDMLVATVRHQHGADAFEPHRRFDYTLIRRQSDAAPRVRPRTPTS